MELLCENNQLLAVNYFYKNAPSQIFEKVPNTALYKIVRSIKYLTIWVMPFFIKYSEKMKKTKISDVSKKIFKHMGHDLVIFERLALLKRDSGTDAFR